MIAINLLPEEFRTKIKRKIKIPGLKIAILVFAFLMFATIFLYVDFLKASAELKKLKEEWSVIEPQSVQIKKLKEEVETVFKPEADFLRTAIVIDKPLTYLLSWISEELPETAWIIEMKIDRVGDRVRFMMKGLVLPSEEKSSIELIEIYLHRLKSRMANAPMNLTTTRQQIGKLNLTLFIANFEWMVFQK